MRQVRRDFDLAHETVRAHGRREIRSQHLHGHASLVLQILREVDDGHAAAADFPLDCVAPCEGRVQAGDGVRHGVIHGGQNASNSCETASETWPICAMLDDRVRVPAGTSRRIACPPQRPGRISSGS